MSFTIKNTKEVHNDGVKVLLFGTSGIGKSSQLGTLEGKTLILSAESGLLVLKDKDIDVIDIDSIAGLAEVYTAIKDGELKYDNICLDSLSEMGEILINELEADDYYGDPSNSFPRWGEYSKRIIKVVKMFRDLKGFNIFFTALSEPVESGGNIKYLPMIPAKKSQAKLVSLFDEVYYYSYDKDNNRVIHTIGSNIYEGKSRAGLDSSYIIGGDVNLGTMIRQIKSTK